MLHHSMPVVTRRVTWWSLKAVIVPLFKQKRPAGIRVALTTAGDNRQVIDGLSPCSEHAAAMR